MIRRTERIRKLVDDGDYVCWVFVGLEKAFDTVYHEILSEEIKVYDLSCNVNNFLKPYLCDCKQYVSINGFVSSSKDVICGAPQGSPLGPVLFLLYINDFFLCLSKTSCELFFDDTFIVHNSKQDKKD